MSSNAEEKFWLALVSCVFLASCAPAQPSYFRWSSDTSRSYQEFLDARYSCLRENQTRISGTVANQSGLSSSNKQVLMCDAFNACLASKGFIRNDTTELFQNNQYHRGISKESIVYCIGVDPYGYQVRKAS